MFKMNEAKMEISKFENACAIATSVLVKGGLLNGLTGNSIKYADSHTVTTVGGVDFSTLSADQYYKMGYNGATFTFTVDPSSGVSSAPTEGTTTFVFGNDAGETKITNAGGTKVGAAFFGWLAEAFGLDT